MSQPIDGTIQATYSDGFVLDETNLKDINPYGEANVFRAVLDKSAELEHGSLIQFSIFWKDTRYDIDWTTLPDNARPIRFKYREIDTRGSDLVAERMTIGFGYQYNDETGNHQEVKELM